MDFLPPEIENYAGGFTTPEPEVLAMLNRETWSKVLMPRMLSGHMQGRILSMFSHMLKPTQVLEIGTYTGYSAICLAEGLKEGGKLHTIDINEELKEMALRYFKMAGMENSIVMHVGAAMEIINNIKGNFDLVFIDADKENYSNYYDLVFDRVSKGGYIIADNVLWSGKVLEDKKKMDDETKALKAYSEKVYNDSRVEALLLPVRDGLMIARKK
jgi:caffeoyl-CoA O-methyltransferase